MLSVDWFDTLFDASSMFTEGSRFSIIFAPAGVATVYRLLA